MLHRHLLPLLTAACLIAGSLSGCSSSARAESKTGVYFDTVITITLYGKYAVDENFDQCFSLASKYESMFSSEIESSDISRINASPNSPVIVSDETIDLLQQAYAYSESTDGLFDITIGKLCDLWNISEIASSGDDAETVIPSTEEITALLCEDGYQYLDINPLDSTVMLTNENLALDVGGIAKGYIADQMKEMLTAEGIDSALINLGGNVLTLGTKPDLAKYTIGIQTPFGDDSNPIATVSLSGQTAVTSGIYQRYFEKDGVIYHHILNPKTGYPEQNDLNSVTILCDSSTDADALSTSVFLMGFKEGYNFVSALDGVEAIFIDRDNNVTFTERCRSKI